MKQIKISGTKYNMFRPIGGHNKDKYNRAAKLLSMFTELDKKFDDMIKRGKGTSDTARMALAVKMLMYTGIRVGNESSAEGYMTKPHPNSKVKPKFVRTYGLSTLLPEHIIIAPRRTLLNFVGKKEVTNSYEITGKLAKQIRYLHKHCNETLFDIKARQLSKFIETYVGHQFSAKDFRTMRANMHVSEILGDVMGRDKPTTKKQYKDEIKEICTYVSGFLSNTPNVCKVSYIDPVVWEYLEKHRSV